MREQRVRLEHHTDITLLDGTVCDIFAVNEHLTFGRLFQPGHQTQYSGFAAAGRAEQGDHAARRNRKT